MSARGKQKSPDNAGLCPKGPEDCPFFDNLKVLKSAHDRLAELSQTDPLTGYYNLRHLKSALKKEMERTQRTDVPTSVIMVDLDHFKNINDEYGHQVGNIALQWAAKLWQKNIRRIDLACRYGGEEFTFVLPATRLPQGQRVAERLRTCLIEAPLEVRGQSIAMTASFGVDIYLPRDSLSVEELLERVDACLLEAKSRGRNCVVLGAERETAISDTEKRALGFEY